MFSICPQNYEISPNRLGQSFKGKRVKRTAGQYPARLFYLFTFFAFIFVPLKG